MPTTIEVESRLLKVAEDYDRAFPSTTRVESRVMARIALAPRPPSRIDDRPRRLVTASILMRQVALICAVLLLAGLLVVGAAKLRSTQISHGPLVLQPRQPAERFSALRFVSATQGWIAETKTSTASPTVLYRTDDGGRSWRSKLTWDGPGPGQLLFSPDGSQGVVVGNLGVPLFSTSDGGEHWQRMALPADISDVALIYFVNPREGWVIAYLNETTPGFAGVFHTTDGARHWTRLTRIEVGKVFNHGLSGGSLQGSLVFRDSSDGWFFGGTFSGTGIPVIEPYMYVTHDGGKTWAVQTLPNTAETGLDSTNASIGPPHFFNQSDGILVVLKTNVPVPGATATAPFLQGSFTYSTVDGGATWAGPQSIVLPEDVAFLGSFDFVDANHWFLLARSGVARTIDAGQHWTTASSWLPRNSFASNIDFQDANHGWAGVVTQGDAAGLAVYQTTDGGDNWTRFSVPTAA